MSARSERRAARREAKAKIATLKREAQARVAAMPVVQQAQRRRRRRRELSSAVLLLLLLFLRCECEPGAPTTREAELQVPEVPDAGKTVLANAVKRPKSKERLSSNARPGYDTGTQGSPAWLDEFRMQVAARSPRLAQCFSGSERPGAIRWNVALNPETGAVSDHLFEPIAAAELTAAQQTCVLAVVSNPGYRIAEADRLSVPPRVALVIEF